MTRVVAVELIAKVAAYNRGMLQAAQATRTVGTEADKLAQKREAFNTLGKGLAVTGAAMLATAALATRAAAQWESAWAGVTKTVDGTPKQMAAVEKGLRDLTKVLPASHTQIAAVAEAAGQLGIATPNVVAFTRTMIDLGETTNLSAEDAAKSLARFVNIMGTSQGEVSNLGSSLVGLGNSFATTESEILEMAMRLAGAGKQIGMSEGDVLGLSAALSSVGIEAEAGGSAMSKVMIDIAASVEKGGDRLQMFADVAGVSAAQFAAQWRSAPSEALSLFVSGLANAEATGTSTLGVLAELGITEVRMRDALLRSASAADMFSGAMQMGNTEFEKNNALLNEAAKRYATVESKMAIAGNAINDMAISFGEVLLPVLGAAAEGVAGLASFLGDLPAPVKAAVSVLGGAVGVLALVGGTALLAVPQIAQFKVALSTLGITMKGLSVAGGAVGVALTALVTIIGAVASAQAEAQARAQAYSDALAQGEDAARRFIAEQLALKDSFMWMDRGSAVENARKLGLSIDEVTAAVTGSKTEFAAFEERVEAAYKAAGSTIEAGYAMEQLKNKVSSLRDAQELSAATTRDAEKANDSLASGMDETTSSTEQLAEAAEEAAGTLDEMKDALDGVADAALRMGDAQDSALSSINGLTDAAKKEGITLNGTNEASIKFRDALRDVEEAHRDSAAAIVENGGSLKDARAEWQRGRDAVIAQLEAMGLSRAEARRWAAANLGSAKEVKGAIGGVKNAFDDATKAAKAVPDVSVSVKTSGLDSAISRLQTLRSVARDVDGNVTTVKVGSVTGRASGGAISGPGTSKSDSIPIMASNGEHMLTAEDVQALGGQAGVYAFRRNLHSGIGRFASGGAITTDSANKAVSAAERAVRDARAEYEDAKAASKRAKSKKAKERAEKAEREALAELQDAKRDLQSARDDALALRRSFRMDLRDWNTGQRRGENFEAGMSGNGLSLVDQLLDIAAQTGGKSGERLRDQARKSEKAYLRLEDAAEKAADRVDTAAGKLADLRNAASSMASGVANAVRGWFNLGKLGESSTSEVLKTRTKRESVTVGGRTYSWEGVESYTDTQTTNPTAGSILAGTQAAEARIKRFADKLKRLAGMGLNPKLLEEIALLGVANGEPVADALLGATSKQISDLNKSYEGIGKFSDLAGSTVADANFGALIRVAERQLSDAERHATDIQKKLETETTRVIKAITDALTKGMKKASGGPIVGPGTGTSDSIPIWASNGEHMIPAWEVSAAGGHDRVFAWRRAMVSGRAPGFAKGGPVLVPTGSQFGGAGAPVVIRELVVKDQDGALIGRMRVEADGVIGARERREVAGMRAEVAEW